MLSWLVLLSALATADNLVFPSSKPAPFTRRIVQSVPCPRDPYGDGWKRPANELPGFPVNTTSTTEIKDVVDLIAPLVDSLRDELRAPSAAVIIIQGGSIMYEYYTGNSKVDGGGSPVGPASAYRIASITKTFTSVMMYQLRDLGKLPKGLDTTVAELLPGFVDPKIPRSSRWTSTRPVTLRSLAMHASGMVREVPTCLDCREDEILAAIGETYLLHPPFAATHYSNLGIALLARFRNFGTEKAFQSAVRD